MAEPHRPVTLYVCYGTFWVPWGHACRKAAQALSDAGYTPDVVRVYGLGHGPALLAETPGRRRVRRISGQKLVPVLEFSDGRVIAGSDRIADWARAHPAPGAGARVADPDRDEAASAG
jgi:glutathione S-transferase